MITLYSGTPGSGKSLHSACMIYWRLRMGKPVICNFDINLAAIKHCKGDYQNIPNDKMTPRKLIEYSDSYFINNRFREGAILLIVDECQLMFNAREWDAQGRKEWLSFFSQHRHYGYDIILVAQFDRMIDRQIRSLIEYDVIHRRVSNFGFWGKLISAVTLGKLFVAVKMWYPLHERVGAEWFKANKKYYSLYDSYKHFETETEKKPEKAQKTEIEQNKVLPVAERLRKSLDIA
jgi:zona occludens toxin